MRLHADNIYTPWMEQISDLAIKPLVARELADEGNMLKDALKMPNAEISTIDAYH